MEELIKIFVSHEEEMRKKRSELKEGKTRRGNFRGRYIELPEKLIEELERVSKKCKKRGLPDSGISSLIRDASIQYLSTIDDNGCLDPDYPCLDKEESKSPRMIIQRIVEELPDKARKKEIISCARNTFSEELKHIDDKTLENYISLARRDAKKG